MLIKKNIVKVGHTKKDMLWGHVLFSRELENLGIECVCNPSQGKN